jgi:tetratricopeptide (TPR) repeat protein
LTSPSEPPQPPRVREGRLLLLLFLFALLLRVAFTVQIRDLPTQHQLVMDAKRYDALARDIVAHGWRPREVFYQAPAYPYFLAAVYAATGGAMAAVRLLQALLGAATAVLAAVSARRLAGHVFAGSATTATHATNAAVAAGLLAALYGPLVFYAPLLLKTTLLLFFEGCLLVLLLPASPSGRARAARALLAGACLGICALLQENSLLLLPFVLLHLLLPQRGDGERSLLRRLAPALACAVGAALAVAPATLANYRAGGELVLTSSQGGMNFFIGNARGATGTYVPLSAGGQQPEQQKADGERLAAAFAARRTGRPVDPASLSAGQVSALFWREALGQIRADPAAWARLMLWKSRLFWNAYELPDAEGYDVYRRAAGGLAWLWLGFGVVAPLGLLGLLFALRAPPARGAARLFALLLAGVWASVALFFVFGRYRMTAVPLLLPPAGVAAAGLIEIGRRREWRRLAVWGAALAVAALVVGLPAFSRAEVREHDAAIYFNLGSAALRWSEESFAGFEAALRQAGGVLTPAAREELERAVRLAGEAAADLHRADAASPGFFVARLQRTVALHRRGVYLASAGALPQAVESYARARAQLAAALARPPAGAPREAVAEARSLAVALDANAAAASNNLGGRLLEAGRLDEAEAALARAVALAPALPRARANLALCLLRLGQRARGKGDPGEALRSFAASRDAYARAAALAASAGREEEAALYRQGMALVAAESAKTRR